MASNEHRGATVWPPPDAAWTEPAAAKSGLDGAKLSAAIEFVAGRESPWPRSFYYPDGRYVGIVEWNETGPWSDINGPVRPRGGPAGVVLHGGMLAATWGDPRRCDMTFSVAKSYLAILAMLAVADGLIPDLDQPVIATVPGALFDSEQNRAITWRHLLTQSSEWQGVLWGKSDQVDHYRQIGAGADNSRKGERRPLQAAGSHYEYNDVRVNLLAYCLLERFGRSLVDVLRERIMQPIGASSAWEWHGYTNSWVEIAGRRVQSVTGGAHWGGGLFINALDHARIGLLMLRRGAWEGRQLLPAALVAQMLTPSHANPSYGMLWWLNRRHAFYRSAPETSYFALGAGGNVIFVDPEHDLVAVMRWIDSAATDEFLGLLLAAVK